MGQKYDEFQKEREKGGVGAEPAPIEQSFLIGKPVNWSEITDEITKREWIWENYIAKGYITLLSALWKAGKSTLLRCLFVAMAQGEEFAGQPITKTRVLVISEEPQSEWFEKKEDLEKELIDQISIWSRPIRSKPNLKQWIQMLDEIKEHCIVEGINLVVIDTLSTFWPIDNENDSAQVLKALVPMYTFTENRIGVLLIHHFRKGGGDQAQASRGSGALPGFVDNIIEFTRKEDGNANQRVLKTYGRFDEVIPTVVIELTNDGTYKTLGTPWEVSKTAKLDRIISIFEEMKTNLCSADILKFWVTSSNSAETSITVRSVRNYVKELVFKKILSAVEPRMHGKRLTPYYALTPDFQELRKTYSPPTTGAFLSSVPTAERAPESLSAVNPQTVPVTEVRKGISAIAEDIRLEEGMEKIDNL